MQQACEGVVPCQLQERDKCCEESRSVGRPSSQSLWSFVGAGREGDHSNRERSARISCARPIRHVVVRGGSDGIWKRGRPLN